MLSESDASRSGKSGLVSASTRQYLKLVIGSVDLQNERRKRLRVRIGAVHEGVDCGGTAHVLSHTRLNPRGRGVPPERKSDRLSWVLGESAKGLRFGGLTKTAKSHVSLGTGIGILNPASAATGKCDLRVVPTYQGQPP